MLSAAVLLVASACAMHVAPKKSVPVLRNLEVKAVSLKSNEECKMCVEFAQQTLQDLLDFILRK